VIVPFEEEMMGEEAISDVLDEGEGGVF
jgi:hypothetical protein